jgi:hypothetical protein
MVFLSANGSTVAEYHASFCQRMWIRLSVGMRSFAEPLYFGSAWCMQFVRTLRCQRHREVIEGLRVLVGVYLCAEGVG